MSGYHHEPRSGFAILALLLALGALLTLVLAPIGYKQEWWDYSYALQSLLKYSAFAAIAALILAIMGIGHTWFGSNHRGMPIALLALLIAGGSLVTPIKQLAKFKSVPVIHDISTDGNTPPAFEASVGIRGELKANSTAYGGEDLMKAQQCAYDTVQPLVTRKDPETAYPIALEIVKQQGWTILATAPRRGRIEAVDTSRWFGFKDDIVIRIAPDTNGSRIDMRSSSRVGKSDLGVNAARITAFLNELEQALGE